MGVLECFGNDGYDCIWAFGWIRIVFEREIRDVKGYLHQRSPVWLKMAGLWPFFMLMILGSLAFFATLDICARQW